MSMYVSKYVKTNRHKYVDVYKYVYEVTFKQNDNLYHIYLKKYHIT